MTVIQSNLADASVTWASWEVTLRPFSIGDSLGGGGIDWATWELTLRAASEDGDGASNKMYPYPIPFGEVARYTQKCVDTVAGVWTYWTTYYQDVDGIEYPGAGFDQATYCIESIEHTQP